MATRLGGIAALLLTLAFALVTGTIEAQSPPHIDRRVVTSDASRVPPPALSVAQLRAHIDDAEWGRLASRGRALGTRLLEHIEASSTAPPNPIPAHLRRELVDFHGEIARLSGREPTEVREVAHGLIMQTIQTRRAGLRRNLNDLARARATAREALRALRHARRNRTGVTFREPVVVRRGQHVVWGTQNVDISFRERTSAAGQLRNEIERLRGLLVEIEQLSELTRTDFEGFDRAANQMMRMLSSVAESMSEMRRGMDARSFL